VVLSPICVVQQIAVFPVHGKTDVDVVIFLPLGEADLARCGDAALENTQKSGSRTFSKGSPSRQPVAGAATAGSTDIDKAASAVQTTSRNPRRTLQSLGETVGQVNRVAIARSGYAAAALELSPVTVRTGRRPRGGRRR
jgi:hypothetical protein